MRALRTAVAEAAAEAAAAAEVRVGVAEEQSKRRKVRRYTE